ncbi:trypsin-like [Copidosoma floridanum]|uniref:trypsin-like n=1 Tax=Copidosoma floridanum TaxID=29053 RepID=UPI000C6FB4DA|nr:trypsin-like [Copidosoma floridanum]
MAQDYQLYVLAALFITLIGNVAGLELENIVGGKTANINDNNYAVSVHIIRGQICSGVLIEDDVVLTAAHCFDRNEKKFSPFKYRDESYFVVAGTSKSTDHTHMINVEKVYLHARYEKRERNLNDIAVLKLQKKFNVINSPNIGVAQLPKKDKNYIGKIAKVLGFGADAVRYLGNGNWQASNFPDVLKQVNVTILDQTDCEADMNQGFLCGKTKELRNQGDQGVCDRKYFYRFFSQ